jgi:DNA-directed RNA polymerase specialized sigma24 family protein
MSAASARRGDARQSGLPSRWADDRRDRRGEERQHRGGDCPTRNAGTATGVPVAGHLDTGGALRSSRPPQRREEVGAFFAREAGRLRRIVASRVIADPHTIEDACAYAWERLAGDPSVELDCGGVAWLATVAIREGWRLTAIGRRESPISAAAATSEHDDRAGFDADRRGGGEDTLSRVEYDERVIAFRTLKCRERRDLFLQALGYRYEEIAAMTGSSYTSVNRRLTEGRAQLRRRTPRVIAASA